MRVYPLTHLNTSLKLGLVPYLNIPILNIFDAIFTETTREIESIIIEMIISATGTSESRTLIIIIVGIKGGIIPSILMNVILGFCTIPKNNNRGIKIKNDTNADICWESLVLVDIEPIIANIDE